MKTKLFLLIGALLVSAECRTADQAPVYIRVNGDFKVKAVEKAPAGKESDLIRTLKPADGAVVPLLSDGQKAYISIPREERIKFFADAKKRQEMKAQGFYPQTVTLEYNCGSSAPHSHVVTVSENKDFAPAITVTGKAQGGQSTLQIGNLKVAQKYYWKVQCNFLLSSDIASKAMSFTTEDMTPRLIRIDGVPNVRDLGGYKGLDGKRIKQGMIYRSAGLNDNASQKYKSMDDVMKDPSLRAEKKERDAIVKACKEALESKEQVRTVPFSISRDWTVFRPAKEAVTEKNYEEFAQLTSIPAEYCGAKAEKVTANSKWCVMFPGKTPYLPTFFIQEFEAADDGVMQIGCGGDWFWQIWINGKKVADVMRPGNMGFPISVNNFALEVPVKKGKNTLTVTLLSGAASWTWCLGKPEKERTHERMLQKRIDMENKFLSGLKFIPDGKQPGKVRLNDAMKEYLIDGLGWKSDIDLRNDAECYGMTGSPVGKDVTWFHISSNMYAGMQTDGGKKAFKEVFKIFLDDKNYPIDFHCIAGQDRTGSVSFILLGLLGVSEEKLYLDWEVTGFWNGSTGFSHKSRFNHLLEGFRKNVKGDTIHEKIENYVLSLGFTKKDIEFFRSKMLE